MGSVDLLLDAPAIPRVLRRLLDRSGEDLHESVLEALPDRERTAAAIEALVAQGLIRKENDRLRIAGTDDAARRIDAIILFYDHVTRVERRKLLFRGILNAAQYSCLVHTATFVDLMKAEGFAPDDMEGMIAADGQTGLVERIRIIYRSKRDVPQKTFPFIPVHYYPHFIAMKTDNPEHLKERLARAGITMTEEEYLFGHYPKEMADQAREYIAREKGHIREKIKNEAFDIWWYYRF